jgi:hypothetical protein
MENGPFIDGLPINSMGMFHGYVSHNQMVPYLANLPGPPINWTWPHGCSAGVLRIALPETGVLMHL